MTQKVIVTKNGIGFCGLLFIILLLLKVGVVETQVIQWSWWIVFAPLWAPTAIFLSILAIIALFGILVVLAAAAVEYLTNK